MTRRSLLPARIMFRFQSPLVILLFLMGWSNVLGLRAWAQVSQPQSQTQPTQVPARQNRTLSLDDAVAIAEANNEELKIAHLEVSQAEEALKIAKTGKLPTLSASGRLFRADNASFSATPGGVLQTAEQAQIQQQTAVNAAQQRQNTRIEFQEQLQRLQIQLDRGTDLSQQDTVDQQLSELANRANGTAALAIYRR